MHIEESRKRKVPSDELICRIHGLYLVCSVSSETARIVCIVTI